VAGVLLAFTPGSKPGRAAALEPSSALEERTIPMTEHPHFEEDAEEPHGPARPFRKLLAAMLLAPVLYLFVLQSVTVVGASMEPRLADNDHLIVNKLLTKARRSSKRLRSASVVPSSR